MLCYFSNVLILKGAEPADTAAPVRVVYLLTVNGRALRQVIRYVTRYDFISRNLPNYVLTFQVDQEVE
jgi:hypothetical protein